MTLEGMPSENGYIRAVDFLRELQLLTSALNKADRDVHPTGEPSSYYRIVNLSMASPATVVMEAQPKDPDTDNRRSVLSHFFSVLGSVRDDRSPPEPTSYGLLEDIAGMVSPVGRTMRSVRISRNGDVIQLGPGIQKTVQRLLAQEETCPGAIRGMLEAINLHMDANTFRIYPDVGPSKVTCHFPTELQQEAISAIKHFVEVRGVLNYRVGSPYPHEILVASIEAFPPEDELPSLWDLKGIAPNATGELASEDFVRDVRNAAD
jgi:hypothetical protein